MLRNARSLAGLAVSMLVLGTVLTAGGVVGTQLVEDGDEPATQDTSYLRVAHASPDAPAVDVTVGTGDNRTVLAENVSYGGASDYVTVPPGNYTVDVREAAPDNDGPVVATTEVALENGSAHSALAIGALEADDAEPFQVVRTEDATVDVELPDTETPTPTITPPPVGNETATPGETVTESPTDGTDTPTEPGEETTTVTEAPSPTETVETEEPGA